MELIIDAESKTGGTFVLFNYINLALTNFTNKVFLNNNNNEVKNVILCLYSCSTFSMLITVDIVMEAALVYIYIYIYS